MRRTLGLAMVALACGAGCEFGSMCWRDRCDPYSGVDGCGATGCLLCDTNDNGSGTCVTDPCWCEPDNNHCQCTSPQYPYCSDDAECPPEERCDQGWCTWAPPEWCDFGQSCAEGQVCSAWNECRDVVLGCPLTNECLADPEGYEPDWMGVDPLYLGDASGVGVSARVELLVDFYDDHLYGDAVAVVSTGGYGEEILDLIVTGTRTGAALAGQVAERNVQPRRFDATFTGQLITASELVGTVTVSMDEGRFEIPFHLYRVSPCGCDPTACPKECCANADCEGGDECVDATCKTPCATNCDCGPGELCQDGYCELP